MREVKPGISSEPRLALDLELDLSSVIVDRQVLIGSAALLLTPRQTNPDASLSLFYLCWPQRLSAFHS